MNPFNLSGPEFLLLYLALAALLVARNVLAENLGGPQTLSLSTVPLSAYEVAFLTGGSTAVVDAALASLSRRGLLDPDPSVRMTAARAALPKREPTAAGEFDQQIDAEILSASGSQRPRLSALRQQLPKAIEKLEAKLVQYGLVVSESSRDMRVRLNAGAFFALAAAGALKIMMGVSRGRPVTILILLVMGTVIYGVHLTRRELPRLTKLGKARIARLRHEYEALRLTAISAPAQTLPSELAMAYALFGSSILVGPLLGLGSEIRLLGSSVDDELLAAEDGPRQSLWQAGDSSEIRHDNSGCSILGNDISSGCGAGDGGGGDSSGGDSSGGGCGGCSSN